MLTKNLISRLKDYFALKKNNRFSLTDDDPLDDNLKTVTIGKLRSPINLSKNDIKLICNYLIINGHVTLNGSTLQLGGLSSTATIDAPTLNINSTGDIKIEAGGQDISFTYSDIELFKWNAVTGMILCSAADPDDFFQTTCGVSGATTISTFDDSGTRSANLTYDIHGHVAYSDPVGFNQFNPVYNATDTDVLFKTSGNKAHLTFGAASTTIVDVHLKFPNVSGNFILLIKQHSSGGGAVTNWKTWDQADGNESTVVWPAATAPTLTTGANKIDIISFYWDNDNHKAYGVASLNF